MQDNTSLLQTLHRLLPGFQRSATDHQSSSKGDARDFDFQKEIQEIKAINLQTYQMVVQGQRLISAQVERQQPVIFRDACDRIAPFHLEFIDCWEALVAVLEVRFKYKGLRKIQRNEWELEDIHCERPIDKRAPFECCFMPGQHVDIEMCFGEDESPKNWCPVCKNVENKATDQSIKW